MSNSNSYIVISPSEDGDVSITPMTKNQLLERLAEDYWGDTEILTRVPDNRDPNYWGRCIVIIKGEVIVPRVVETATHYAVD